MQVERQPIRGDKKIVYLYGDVFQGNYTNPAAGQEPFKGWFKAGIKRCKALTGRNKKARASEGGMKLEADFLAELRKELGLTAESKEEEQRAKRRKTVVEEEEDSDDDDDFFDFKYTDGDEE